MTLSHRESQQKLLANVRSFRVSGDGNRSTIHNAMQQACFIFVFLACMIEVVYPLQKLGVQEIIKTKNKNKVAKIGLECHVNKFK